MRICDKCNNAYLERQLLMPFWKRTSKIKEMVDEKEREEELLTEKIQNLEKYIFEAHKKVGSL